MNHFINIGFGNMVNSDRIVAIVSPDAAPVKRLVQTAKEEKKCIDATQGRKTKTVMVMESGHTVLSALVPETISRRLDAVGAAASVQQIGAESEEE